MNDDLISREALRRRMYHEVFEADNGMLKWDSGLWIRYKIFEYAIEEAPSAQPVQQWIPVSERLPEENKPVLVTHHGKYQAFVSVDWRDPYTHEWNMTLNVTAWMPLPKPYKEEKNNDKN